MKIIKQGIDPATQPIQVTCNNCSTVVEFLPTEKGVTRTYGDYNSSNAYSFECPCCGTKIISYIRTPGDWYDCR